MAPTHVRYDTHNIRAGAVLQNSNDVNLVARNREYLAPQIRSMINRFHLEARLPWSYDYPLANHIATNKGSANREMPLVSRLYPSFGYLLKIFPPRGLKYSLLARMIMLM